MEPMVTHKLKTWPEYFDAVWRGAKLYELRRDDREYALGDVLLLREWSPGKPVGCPTGCPLRHVHEWEQEPGYTGREIVADVVHLLRGGKFGLKEGYVILSLKIVNKCVVSSRFPKIEP